MKHSAKGAAKLARQREKQARRLHAGASGRSRSAAAPGPAGPQPSPAGPQPSPAVRTSTLTSQEQLPGPDDSATSPPGPAERNQVSLQVDDRPASATRTGSRPAKARLAQLPYALVIAAVVIGLALMRGGGQAVRSGTLVIAGALLAGSLTRLVLPEGRAGLLGSRRRLVDVASLTALGVGLLIAGLLAKVPR